MVEFGESSKHLPRCRESRMCNPMNRMKEISHSGIASPVYIDYLNLTSIIIIIINNNNDVDDDDDDPTNFNYLNDPEPRGLNLDVM